MALLEVTRICIGMWGISRLGTLIQVGSTRYLVDVAMVVRAAVVSVVDNPVDMEPVAVGVLNLFMTRRHQPPCFGGFGGFRGCATIHRGFRRLGAGQDWLRPVLNP